MAIYLVKIYTAPTIKKLLVPLIKQCLHLTTLNRRVGAAGIPFLRESYWSLMPCFQRLRALLLRHWGVA
jgi:hypothetical protein